MADVYQVGQPATLSAEFLNAAGSLADPTTVALTVTDPNNVVTVYTYAALQVIKDAVGKYHFDLTLNVAGAWTWQWNTTGTPTTTQTGYLVAVAKGADGIHDSVAPWASLSELAAQSAAVNTATGAQVGLAEWFLQVATNLAFAASGRQFPGLVEAVVRPQHRSTMISGYWPGYWPIGQSNGSGLGGGGGICACNAEPHRSDGGWMILSEVWLADAVQGIIQVLVNGTVVPASSYALHDRMFLVRTDGQVWPCTQDFTQDPTVAGTSTFQVTYLRGKMPPPEGRQAVIDMAAEMYAAKSGSDCALPDALAQLVREGETLTFQTPTGIDLYHTGIRSWDWFVSAHNPAHRARRATISSPDVGPRFRRVGTG